jgi:dynein heavy chain
MFNSNPGLCEGHRGCASFLRVTSPTVLQMYDNIALLKFNDGDSGEKLVSAMISAEGEVMDFRRVIRAEGRVEDWMTAVLNEMRRTNRLITKEAIFRYCEDRSR